MKVSIIIPLHNSKAFIQETLESCINQTYKNIEIIVVENGSTDQSWEFVNTIIDSRLQCYTIETANAAAARNYGYRKSTGNYIMFLDADDVLALDKIELQMQLMQNYKDDVLISCAWGKFKNDTTKAHFETQKVWNDFAPVDWLVTSFTGGGMMQTACWLTPRKLIEKAGLWNEKLTLHDDGAFFCRVIMQAHTIVFSKDAKVYYRQIETSLSHQNKSYSAAVSALEVAVSYKNTLLPIDNSLRVKRALHHVFKNFIYQYHLRFPDLIKIAKQEMTSLQSNSNFPVGGTNFNRLTKLVGFNKSLEIRALFQKSLKA